MGDSHEVAELQGTRPKWRLTLEPDAFRLEPMEAGVAFQVPRAERVARVDLMNGLLTRRLLGVAIAGGKKLFRLDPAGYAAYEAWAGPPTLEDLRKSLKRRFGWSVTLGLFIIFTSLPISGDPESGLADIPLNPLSLAMGVALIAAGLLSRFLPSRWFLLADACWIAIAAMTTVDNLVDAPGAVNALLLVIQVNYVLSSLKEFRRFGAMREDVDPAKA